MDAGVSAGEPARQTIVAPDADALAASAADEFVARATAAVEARGIFLVALSGGNTPRALYRLLAQAQYRTKVDWQRVQIFFSDERFVPPDSPDSNYRMVHDTLLSKVPIPDRFVHQVATVDTPIELSASTYEEGIRRVFEVGEVAVPSFDLILLGLGTDGHTASLFPDTEALTVTDRLVAPNFAPALETWRITFTFPLINAAQCILFLVEGEGKASVVGRVLRGEDLPAARVRPERGQVLWLLDEAAAAELPVEARYGGRRPESV